jgi:polysaccharide chain length determinant protein (PEP-CTERM system associated)
MRQLRPDEYWGILRRRWVLIVALAILGAPIAYGVSKFLPSRYSSKTLVLIEGQTVSRELVHPVVTEDISQRLASMQQQVLSRTRLEPIIQQYGLYAADAKAVPMEDLVARLQKAIDVSAIRPMEDTSSQLPGFTITVTLDNPRDAQNVCSAITSMFIQDNERLRAQHSENATEFFAQQLSDAKAKLDEQDKKLAAFQSQHMGALPDDDKTNLNTLTMLTSQLDAATQSLGRAQQDKSFVESQLNQALDAWHASQGGHNPQTLEQQLVALQNKLSDLEIRYTDNYPDVVAAKQDIEALKKKIADQNQTAENTPDAGKAPAKSSLEPEGVQRLRAQIHILDQQIAEKTREQEEIRQQIRTYQNRVQASPGVEQEYKELTRGYNTALEIYSELQKNLDQASRATELNRRQEGELLSILDPANLPDRPTFPNRPLFALGGFGGGMALGLGLALLLEIQDTSIRNERDVESALRLPVIAMLPAVGALANRKPTRSLGPLSSKPELGIRADA